MSVGTSGIAEFIELCRSRRMPEHGYPSEQRLRDLLAVPGAFLLAIRRPGDSARVMLGAAVIYRVGADAVRQLKSGEWKDGSHIGRRHLSQDPYAAAYISCLVSAGGVGPGVLRRVTDWFQQTQVSEVFARPVTPEGKRLARKALFEPVRPGQPIWQVGATPLSRRLPRLGRYDRWSARVSRAAGIASGIVARAAPILVVGVPAVLAYRWPELLPFLDRRIDSVAVPVAATAAALGGLASTIFFLTAQLRVSGLMQYGMTSIYRVRAYVPLLLLTASSVVFGLVALLLNNPTSTEGFTAPIALLAALTSHVLLIAVIFLLGVRLVTNMDPVTLARHFALGVRGSDAHEWGVVRVRPAPFRPDGYLVQINHNRTNFGLRDPLMPVHELMLSASVQRYGQLLSVLAERVAHAYRVKWTMQFPDYEAWDDPPAMGFWQKLHRRLYGKSEAKFRMVQNRLQLVMLVLHYIRRLHRNSDLRIWPDARRQAAQFVLSRVIVVLVMAARDARDDRRREIGAIITHCIDLVLGISADFLFLTDDEQRVPHGRSERLRAFMTATVFLHEQGYPAQARHAALALGWIRRMPDSPLTLSRVPDLDLVFVEHPELAAAFATKSRRRITRKTAGEAPYSENHAWRDLVTPRNSFGRGRSPSGG